MCDKFVQYNTAGPVKIHAATSSTSNKIKINEQINYNILVVPTSRGVKRRARQRPDPRPAFSFILKSVQSKRGKGRRRVFGSGPPT